MVIKINALDTLFFKDGKPFSMGDEAWATGNFPPYPSVIYGALRTAFFADNINLLNLANTENDPTKELKINKILFLIDKEYYTPIPRDLVKKKSNKEESFLLKLSKNDFINSSESEYLLTNPSNDEIENIDDGIIRLKDLHDYLSASKFDKILYTKISDYITEEPKVGIGRENVYRTTASNSKIYNINMIRPVKIIKGSKPVSIDLIVDFENLDLPENGIFKLGAEGKTIHYESHIIKNSDNINYSITNNKIIKLYLNTPAIFEKGFIPNFESSLLKKFGFNLLAASIGKPINIGGFDMKKNKPKTMYKAVPFGSVYYVSSDVNVSEIANELNGKSISDYKGNEGFGIVYVGGYNG